MFGNDQFTKVLLHFDGTNGSTTITDNNVGGSAHTWTNHNGAIDTSSFKFGGASYNTVVAAIGTGYVDTPDSADYTLGSSDFTIDSWFNTTGGAGNRVMAGQRDLAGVDESFQVRLDGANLMNGEISVTGTGFAANRVTGTTAFSSPGWHHVAFVRTGNILRLFLDGVQEGGDVAIVSPVFDSASTLAVGRGGANTAGVWTGFIDEFRMSVGIARWTSNFTPPNEPYDVPVSSKCRWKDEPDRLEIVSY